MDLARELENAVRNGIAKAVGEKLGDYNSPINDYIKQAIEHQGPAVRGLVGGAIATALASAGFREQIESSVRKKLADLLVQRFGGEMEKQVNALKSDPATRARITVAIDEIIKSTAKGTDE